METSYFTANLASLKRCNLVYNIISIYFVVAGGLYFFAYMYFAFIAPRFQVMDYLIDAVMKLPFLVFGYLGCYKKKNLYSVLAVFVIFINTAIVYARAAVYNLDELLCGLAIVSAIVLYFVNKRYHELELCEGFPYFNQRYSEITETSKKDTYKELYEQHLQRSEGHSGEMDEL